MSKRAAKQSVQKLIARSIRLLKVATLLEELDGGAVISTAARAAHLSTADARRIAESLGKTVPIPYASRSSEYQQVFNELAKHGMARLWVPDSRLYVPRVGSILRGHKTMGAKRWTVRAIGRNVVEIKEKIA